MSTPSNVPVRAPKEAMATEQYVRRKPYAKKPYSKKTPKATRYAKYPVTKSYVAAPRAPPKVAMKVSDCAMRYMATLCNPFEAEPGACVPCDLFPIPSQKIRAFTRGNFQLGTSGFGFIQCSPTAANDGVAARFSTSTTSMAVSTLVSVATNIGQAQMAQLPYTTAQVTAPGSVQARIVACGVRVRYAGTEGGRSGTVVSYEDQDHAPTEGLTFLTAQQAPSAVITRPSGDGSWDGTVCLSGPVTPGELEFQSLVYPCQGVSSQTAGGAPILIIIQGVAGDTYNFEVFEHLEYIGTAVGAKTPSNADTDQYGKIIQSTKEIAAVQPLTPGSGPGLFERFAKKVSESLPQLISVGMGAARALEGDPGGYAQLLGGAASMIMGGGPAPRPGPAPRSNQYYPPRLTDRQRAIMG